MSADQDFVKFRGTPAPPAATDTGIGTSVKLPIVVGEPMSNPLRERFAQALARGASHADAYRAAGYRAGAARTIDPASSRLAARPDIRARVRELQAAGAVETVASIEQRMAWLRLIVSADPNELRQVIVRPCGSCWSDALIAERMAAALAEGDEIPDANSVRDDCETCSGAGISTTTITPTARLSAAGRALIKCVKHTRNGGVEYETHDQLAAADLLNKMQSVYISKSLNLSATVNVPPAGDVSRDEALQLFEMFDRDAPRPLVAQVFDSAPQPKRSLDDAIEAEPIDEPQPAPRVVPLPSSAAPPKATSKPAASGIATMCGVCGGIGETLGDPCGSCNGSGVVRG